MGEAPEFSWCLCLFTLRMGGNSALKDWSVPLDVGRWEVGTLCPHWPKLQVIRKPPKAVHSTSVVKAVSVVQVSRVVGTHPTSQSVYISSSKGVVLDEFPERSIHVS